MLIVIFLKDLINFYYYFSLSSHSIVVFLFPGTNRMSWMRRRWKICYKELNLTEIFQSLHETLLKSISQGRLRWTQQLKWFCIVLKENYLQRTAWRSTCNVWEGNFSLGSDLLVLSMEMCNRAYIITSWWLSLDNWLELVIELVRFYQSSGGIISINQATVLVRLLSCRY